jgi:transcriptional regulator with GAF, ATPase, and Fis domain
MRQLFTLLERIAPTEDTVLVEGETGTGKELVAEAIHEQSQRAAGPFIVFDCSAVSEGVLESELFGHLRGAFTGAVADRLGAFEAADGGTLFLDEIGELPIQLQPKLLRAIERGEIRPVGDTNPRRIDVRIVAATNRNLADEVSRGRFREDLFYRIAVVSLRLPPLRERLDDVPLLVDHFVEQLRRGRRDAQVPESAQRAFRAHAWPGNVRELRNAVARSLSLGHYAEVQPAAVGEVDLSVPLKVARDRVAEAHERAYLREALRRAGGNVTHAAEIAGVSRRFIQRAMKRYALDET